MADNKNLLIYGLGLGAVLFFVYLIVREHNKTLLAAIKPVTYQPTIQQVDNLQLQQLQLQTQELQAQTKQINDTLTFQNQELQLLHELQLKQQQNITNLESVKCSNVVSMNDEIDYVQPTSPTLNNLKTKKFNTSNVKRENEEYVSNKIFGIK